ncbi:hypothetical protein [Gemmiger formicilis]|uniref:hypothetical protein n=1 Tax=Gemmiger formicilis TaxID=745368 RepID=UPI002431BDC7|nr:hypothetical protein [Gemmiger formicilis]
MNKKEKSTNTSPYPDEVIDRLARAFYPAILACWNSEEGQREFAAWQAKQAHHANNEKQKVPTGAFLPRGTQSAGHGLFESALLLLHKIHAKQKEQHPIRCCSWCDREDSNLWPSGSENCDAQANSMIQRRKLCGVHNFRRWSWWV